MTGCLSVVVAGTGPRTYVTELAVPEPVTVLQVLHSRMLSPNLSPSLNRRWAPDGP